MTSLFEIGRKKIVQATAWGAKSQYATLDRTICVMFVTLTSGLMVVVLKHLAGEVVDTIKHRLEKFMRPQSDNVRLQSTAADRGHSHGPPMDPFMDLLINPPIDPPMDFPMGLPMDCVMDCVMDSDASTFGPSHHDPLSDHDGLHERVHGRVRGKAHEKWGLKVFKKCFETCG
jgi:hypothetical protein